MRAFGRRSQLVLFVAAVLAPCAVLIALGIRIIGQDRELQVKRRADESRMIAAQGRDALLASLEAIRRGEATTALAPGQPYRYPETVFVGWAEKGQLVLPWEAERDQAVRRGREVMAQPPFEPAIRACAPHAAACYERAVAVATHPQQAAYGQWLLALALDSNGDSPARALGLYRALLGAAPEVTDPDGIPLALHAAVSILQRGAADPRVAPALEAALAARPWLSPLASYVATEIAGRAQAAARTPEEQRVAAGLLERAEEMTRLLEQAEALQNEFPKLLEAWQGGRNSRWIAYGKDLWLLGAAAPAGEGAPVIAVRGAGLFTRAAPPGTRFTDSREPGGEPLGENLAELKLIVPADVAMDASVGPDRLLFYVAMALAVTVTMFAAWLLWRDLQREMRLSELRAQFVASVSHELKTPLTAIRMFAETLQMGRCEDRDTQSEYLGTIVNECERLGRLVDGVLLFAKSENDRKIWHFRAVQPLDAVRAALRALEYPLSEQGFQLHLDVAEHLPAIQADRDALEQAVLNLVSNAIKFSGDSRDIRLGLRQEGGELVLAVTDFGIGVAPEEHERIFEKFYRARATEIRAIPGAGLGLALVAQIMKAHGGSWSVAGSPGKGSTFTLRFPIQEAHS
jgi:nitrogen-specific signal transduction histidine kinase